MKAEFEKYVENKKVKENKNTGFNYGTALGHLQDFLDQEGIEDFEESDIVDFVKYLNNKEPELNGNSKKNYVGYVASYYEDQGEDEIAEELRDYTFETAELGQSGAFHRKYVNKEEYSIMKNNVETIREELIIKILWETGIRAVELSELTLSRVKTDENKIRVKTAKIPKDSDRDKYRTIPYHPSLNSVLREWIDYGGRDKYSTAEDSSYLICTQNSEQISSNYVNTIVRRVADRSGVTRNRTPDKDIDQYFPTAHSFRHSYGTYRASSSAGKGSMNLEQLRKLMGHGELEQVIKYVTMMDEDLERANKDYRPEDIDHVNKVANNL